MINPYVIIAVLVALIASHGTAYYYGGEHRENAINAQQLKATNKAIAQADVQAVKDNQVIKFVEVEKEVIKNVYIKVRDKVNENIDKNPVYSECGLDADGLRLYNTHAATEANDTGKPADRLR
jgi:hypothetical protein